MTFTDWEHRAKEFHSNRLMVNRTNISLRDTSSLSMQETNQVQQGNDLPLGVSDCQASQNVQWPVNDKFLSYFMSISRGTSIASVLSHFAAELATPVGGRLRAFADRWHQLGASSYMTSSLRKGIRLSWYQWPPLTGLST